MVEADAWFLYLTSCWEADKEDCDVGVVLTRRAQSTPE